jgi:molecular chaperone Hsp33
MDAIIKGISLAKEIRFTYADVTDSARVLCERHENGRAAAVVLGEALAACALLSADSDSPGESVQMQLNCDGPLAGFQVEVTGTGDVRGYTKQKRLAKLDKVAEFSAEKVLGKNGGLTVIVSTPSKVVYSGHVAANPPEVRSATARYYNQSLQISTGVEILAVLDGDKLERAMAIVAQKMPGGDTDAFVQVLEAFQEGKVKEMLKSRKEGEPLWDVFGLEDIETTDSRPLAFGCRCSEEAVLHSMAAFETEEITEIIDSTGSQEVTCHMCGEIYVVPEDALLQILIARGRGK